MRSLYRLLAFIACLSITPTPKLMGNHEAELIATVGCTGAGLLGIFALISDDHRPLALYYLSFLSGLAAWYFHEKNLPHLAIGTLGGAGFLACAGYNESQQLQKKNQHRRYA